MGELILMWMYGLSTVYYAERKFSPIVTILLQNEAKRHSLQFQPGYAIGVVLVSLLLTLNIFHTLF